VALAILAATPAAAVVGSADPSCVTLTTNPTLACTNAAAWGNAPANFTCDGSNAALLNSDGDFIRQSVTNLLPGAAYELRFRAVRVGANPQVTVQVSNARLADGTGVDVDTPANAPNTAGAQLTAGIAFGVNETADADPESSTIVVPLRATATTATITLSRLCITPVPGGCDFDNSDFLLDDVVLQASALGNADVASGDALTDLEELCISFTDPFLADTDRDGVRDDLEVQGGATEDLDGDNEFDPGEDRNGNGRFDVVPNLSNPLDPDTDGDGLCDGNVDVGGAPPTGVRARTCIRGEDENVDGLRSPTRNPDYTGTAAAANRLLDESDPSDADSDDDGRSDREEQERATGCSGAACRPTNPQDPDTDGDGLCDGRDIVGCEGEDLDGDRTVNGQTASVALRIESDPLDADSDDDGVNDGAERAARTHPRNADSDGDGVRDDVELNLLANPAFTNRTNVLDPDSDCDGLCDGGGAVTAAAATAGGFTFAACVEAQLPITGCVRGEDLDGDGVQDIGADTTGDGIPDSGETSPGNVDPTVNSADVDGDGLLDGSERRAGSNPFDPDSDDDTLCDSVGGVPGVCTGGEDLNGNGVLPSSTSISPRTETVTAGWAPTRTATATAASTARAARPSPTPTTTGCATSARAWRAATRTSASCAGCAATTATAMACATARTCWPAAAPPAPTPTPTRSPTPSSA